MGSIYKPIFEKAKEEGFKAYSKQSREWFYQTLLYMRNLTERRFVMDPELKLKPRFKTGRMYMFGYDPKGKDTLPYYDTFPLVILVDKVPGGFRGINLHYLHPFDRAKLLDSLMKRFLFEPKTSRGVSVTKTKLRISYAKLESSFQFRRFKPAFKRYSDEQVKTRIILVPPKHWETSLFLPSENFQGDNKRKVWRDSIKKFRQSN